MNLNYTSEDCEEITRPYEVSPEFIDQVPPFMADRGYRVSETPRRTMVETDLHADKPLTPVLNRKRPLWKRVVDGLIGARAVFWFEVRDQYEQPY